MRENNNSKEQIIKELEDALRPELKDSVSEGNHSNQALKESEQIFRAIFHNATDGILLTDNESKKFFMGNTQICKTLGYGPDEIKTLEIMDIHPEKDLPYILDQFEKLLRNDIAVARDIPVKKKDGSIYYADISALPIPLIGKTLTIGIFRDITDQKLAEEKLKRYQEHLEELIQERTANLAKAYEHLKQENDIRRTTEVELGKRTKDLEEMNSALRVILKQREDDKFNLENNVISNIKMSVLPYVEKIDATGLREEQREYLYKIRLHLEEITSPFIKKLSSSFLSLTPTELQIASLVREGKRSKDIAEFMNISINTVHTYRNIIRSKLGLKNDKVNLLSYLNTFGSA
jgi:PAS domain S-box-containing protein